MIQALLVTICLVVFPYQGSSIILESGNVNGFEVVYPQKVSTLPKGGVQNAEPEIEYEDAMQYEFKVNGEPVVLHLERNKGLFSKDYTETHYSPDGREITTSPPVEDHCYYHGHIQNEADLTAVISACNGLKGHFKYQGETYLIEHLKLSKSGAHAVYKSKNIEMEDESPKNCGVTQTTWESDEYIKTASQLNLTVEQQRYLQAQKYIELVVVVDNKMYKKYKSDLCLVRTRIYEIINIINTMVRILKIHVALIAIEIWSDGDKIDVQESVEATLQLFEEWRETDLLPRKRHDNAQLLTDVDFEGNTVGYAPMGSLCSSNQSVAIIQDHTQDTSLMATTMAHQLGHNLGMSHDTNACNCSANTCIMTRQISDEPFYNFSSCSLEQFQKFLITNLPQCILNKPLKTDIVAPAVCGNDLLEKGEECDCGLPQDCQSTCCHPATCELMYECEFGECCEQCRFMKAKTLCRAAKDDCDKAEYCTGESAECPKDRFRKNWAPCQNNQGYCYEGKCPILANQCIALFNDSDMIAGEDECFDKNKKGDEYFHCRTYEGVNIPCESKDVKCGRLFCTTRSSESTEPCNYTFSISDPDYGMVELGTMCGDGKFCGYGECRDLY